MLYNYRFLILFDASMCNPMPDPITGNPRKKWTNGCGFITPQAVKYRIKKYLYEKGEKILHYQHYEDYTVVKEINAYKISPEEAKKKEKQYLDIRLFGTFDASTDKSNGDEGNSAKIIGKGPVSVNFPVSVDPITSRIVSTNRAYKVDVNKDGSNQGSSYANDSAIVEYGLYSCYGGINALEANETGITDEDMEKYLNAIVHMFDNDYSTMRPLGSMLVRHLFVWKWKEEPISDLIIQKSVQIKHKEGIINPASFQDYVIKIENLPCYVGDYVQKFENSVYADKL